MPKRPGKPFSKKVKRRAPIRQAFHDEYIKDSKTLLSVQFRHRDNRDELVVRALPTRGAVPTEYEGYPIVVVEVDLVE